MDLSSLSSPLEGLDAWLTDLLDGAPLLVALGIALVLGLRHASDPDHLVAVTSLVALDGGDVRRGVRLGWWWGAGHAATLVLVGLPLIALKADLPHWLSRGAETSIGLIVVVLAARVLAKWSRGDYRVSHAGHDHDHRHLHRGQHRHEGRTGRQAAAIGILHGLGGTGAVVVLLIAALPTRLEAATALAVFAPMSALSMAAMTGLYARALTRRLVDPLYRSVLIPLLGTFGLLFGVWYAGLA
jgi:high-affinity nickel permease